MARSSTTYSPKWQCGKTRVIRVPSALADEIMTVAMKLDAKRAPKHRRACDKADQLAMKRARMRVLESELNHLRGDCEYTGPGELLFASPTNSTPDTLVVVAADGFGGAVTKLVVGNYPFDYQTLSSRRFSSESRAMKAAERMASG